MTPSEARCFDRIHTLVREAVRSRALTFREIAHRMGQSCANPVYRTMRGVVTLQTLIHVADALDYDVIIHLRDRRGGEATILQGRGHATAHV